MEQNKILFKIQCFIKQNIVLLVTAVLFAAITYTIPLNSGDDWTFATWYHGLSNVPTDWIWSYEFFNGRPTLHFMFSIMLYYFDIWFLWTPISVIVLLVCMRTMLKITSKKAQLLIMTLLLCFSWEMCRNLYLWPTGNIAYLVIFAMCILAFCMVHQYCLYPPQHLMLATILLSLAIFLLGFETENVSVALAGMYGAYLLLRRIQDHKFSQLPLAAFAASFLSAALCILNPAGKRFDIEMQSVKVPFFQMVLDNFYTIVKYFVKENGFLVIVLGALILLLFRQGTFGFRTKWMTRLYCGFLCVGLLAITVAAIPAAKIVVAFGTSNKLVAFLMQGVQNFNIFVFSKNLGLEFLWTCFLLLELGSVFLIQKDRAEQKNILISLIIFAGISVGVFLVLPEISQRSMFFALAIIVFYSGFLFQKLQLDAMKRNVAIALIGALLLLRVDAFAVVLQPAYAVTQGREAIIAEYHLRTALGEKIDKIVLPAYAQNSIGWDDCNSNPQLKVKPYAYEAMKNYYRLPKELDVQMAFENTK